jgi:hypothetical protein
MAATSTGTDRRLKTIGNVFLLIFVIWTVIPFYWMIVTPLKDTDEIYGTTATIRPKQPILDNYRVLFFETNYFLFFRNSVVVALATTLLTVSCASLAAYAIARLGFPGRKLLARGMIYTYLVPRRPGAREDRCDLRSLCQASRLSGAPESTARQSLDPFCGRRVPVAFHILPGARFLEQHPWAAVAPL